MSFSIIDTSKELKSVIYNDQHITIYVYFKVNGTLVDVDNPEFVLKDENGSPVPTELLKPLQKDNVQEPGKYIVTFLSKGLNPGNYTAIFSGIYQSNPVTVTETLYLRDVPRTQYLIELLRSTMYQRYTLEVPRKFMTFDPTKKQWEDGDLYTCLVMSCNRINEVVPTTDFTLDDIPCINFLILGAQIYALTQVDILEELNYFDISIPYKVNVYKGDKLQGLMRFIKDSFETPLKDWKRDWYINNVGPRVITHQRVPVRLLRPISDQLYLHSIGW